MSVPEAVQVPTTCQQLPPCINTGDAVCGRHASLRRLAKSVQIAAWCKTLHTTELLNSQAVQNKDT